MFNLENRNVCVVCKSVSKERHISLFLNMEKSHLRDYTSAIKTPKKDFQYRFSHCDWGEWGVKRLSCPFLLLFGKSVIMYDWGSNWFLNQALNMRCKLNKNIWICIQYLKYIITDNMHLYILHLLIYSMHVRLILKFKITSGKHL